MPEAQRMNYISTPMHYIMKLKRPIHDTANLCQYGQNILEANDPSYLTFETYADARQKGGRPCKECAKVRNQRTK